MAMSWNDRIDHYVQETGFPRSMFICGEGDAASVVGYWVLGNDYRVTSKYYGGYPAGYLKRIRALFPDKNRVLHLFAGMVDLAILPGDTVDMNPALNPTFLDDAHTLENVPLEDYDLVLADPPYSVEDADHYGPPMIQRKKVFDALARVKSGTPLVWLDQASPMYRGDLWKVEARIGLERSTNHRFRTVKVFRRR